MSVRPTILIRSQNPHPVAKSATRVGHLCGRTRPSKKVLDKIDLTLYLTI